MNLNLGKNISPRTAGALVALAALLAGGASLLASRDSQPAAEAVAAVAPRVDASRPADDRSAAIDLDLARLQRPAQEGQVAELFAARAPQVPGQPGQAGQPGATTPPGPPALPFQYLGKLIRDGKLMVFLAKGADLYTVQPGQLVENQYKVDRVTEEAVTFTYMPMGASQTLAIPARS